MRKIKISDGTLELRDEVDGFFEKTVTPFGTGAKIDCSKDHIGKRAYVVVTKK